MSLKDNGVKRPALEATADVAIAANEWRVRCLKRLLAYKIDPGPCEPNRVIEIHVQA